MSLPQLASRKPHLNGHSGLPHKATENDVYEGMFIPNGTLVLANIWQVLRSPVAHILDLVLIHRIPKSQEDDA